MARINSLSNLKKPKRILAILLILMFVFSLLRNISRGYFIVPPPLDETVTWITFQSQIKPISIKQPERWISHDYFRGNHGDETWRL
jgi:hypothetical protein